MVKIASCVNCDGDLNFKILTITLEQTIFINVCKFQSKTSQIKPQTC
jgi:hypothetical protein